jgi:hypothetical protein
LQSKNQGQEWINSYNVDIGLQRIVRRIANVAMIAVVSRVDGVIVGSIVMRVIDVQRQHIPLNKAARRCNLIITSLSWEADQCQQLPDIQRCFVIMYVVSIDAKHIVIGWTVTFNANDANYNRNAGQNISKVVLIVLQGHPQEDVNKSGVVQIHLDRNMDMSLHETRCSPIVKYAGTQTAIQLNTT